VAGGCDLRETLRGLQALRGVACLLVVLYHLGQYEARLGLGTNFLAPYQWFGYAGVDLFFVLSGFVIAHAHRGRLGRPRLLPGYVARRVWRIYPVYWCAWLLGLAVTTQVYGHDVSVLDWRASWAGWLTLLPIDGTPPNLFVPQAWTLTYELAFYAAFAAFFVAPRLAGGLFVLWGCLVVARLATGFRPTPLAADVALGGYVLEFLAGLTLAFGRVRVPAVAAAAGLGWLVAGSLLFNTPGNSNALMDDPAWRVLVFGPAAAVLVGHVVARERANRFRPPAWLLRVGDASYSIYLTHMPVVYALWLVTIRWPHERAPHAAWLLLLFAAMVGSGFVLYYAVERPLVRLARRQKAARIPVDAVGAGG
jgi:exopolysaccharide production protein ExoZ